MQNEARRQLFDSFAEYTMRAAGVPVWDIAAYSSVGDQGPGDMFHQDAKTVRDTNLDLAANVLC